MRSTVTRRSNRRISATEPSIPPRFSKSPRTEVRTGAQPTPTIQPATKGVRMPYGSWVNDLPTGFFLVVHIAAFAIGAGFAWLAYKRELGLLGGAFSLFAVAELVYMTYHLDGTVFLFAHTIAEVLDLTAFVLVFAAAVYSAVRRAALNTVQVNR